MKTQILVFIVGFFIGFFGVDLISYIISYFPNLTSNQKIILNVVLWILLYGIFLTLSIIAIILID